MIRSRQPVRRLDYLLVQAAVKFLAYQSVQRRASYCRLKRNHRLEAEFRQNPMHSKRRSESSEIFVAEVALPLAEGR